MFRQRYVTSCQIRTIEGTEKLSRNPSSLSFLDFAILESIQSKVECQKNGKIWAPRRTNGRTVEKELFQKTGLGKKS